MPKVKLRVRQNQAKHRSGDIDLVEKRGFESLPTFRLPKSLNLKTEMLILSLHAKFMQSQ